MKRFTVSELCRALSLPLPQGQAALQGEIRPDGHAELVIDLPYAAVYGMGEKYDALNQKGRTVTNRVEEKFCFQGDKTYNPAPFFWTDSGFGLYADTREVTRFAFEEQRIRVELPAECEVVLFSGTPGQIIRDYVSLFGPMKLPPKWAFGPWISANHWDTQQKTLQAARELDTNHCPATVLVLEAWSDEATFYIFNGARFVPKDGGRPLGREDFSYPDDGPWPDPDAMIEELHRAGLHLVLWQVPVYKKQGSDEVISAQNELDRQDAAARGLCVHNADGTPYTIPQGHWFAGSMIPDFTNPETVRSWFARRKYLLEMGVDGFKTDGGEFVCDPDVRFADGSTGLQGTNAYPQSYTSAYTDFIGPERVLFSRAGYAGQHTTPCHWAGDQQSVNSELRGALNAGLSAAMTGIPFWGFDIAGFAGPLPTPDLYRRATMMACFCPIMQWHSEPDGGQFRELMPGGEGNNERSPWNMEKASGQAGFAEEMAFWHRVRMNLLPYLYSEALRSVEESAPMMRPLAYLWPHDPQCVAAQEEYMLGESLLVAPLLEEEQCTRTLYLPQGRWYSLFTHRVQEGGCVVESRTEERFPVYLREGQVLALHLPSRQPLGTDVGNGMEPVHGLRLILAGEQGSCLFRTAPGAPALQIRWDGDTVELPPELSCAEVERWR